MSTRRQHIRNTRAYLEASFTPLLAEYPFDTTLNTIRVGDGATLGGLLIKRWGYSFAVSPAQIVADTNNYAPTDFAVAETLYLTTDAARTLTGLAGGYANARRTIVNRGAFDITLSNANASSTAANRFLFEADIVIRPNGSMDLQYSATDSRWMRATGGTKFSTVPQEFILAGTLTPAQITSNQNDYAPTGVTLAAVLRLNTDASRNITGIADARDGVTKLIVNVGSFPIVLKNADAGSTAANRFDFGTDVTLSQKQVALIKYDGTDARWKLIASTAGAAVADGAVTAVKLASSGVAHGPIVNGYLEWTVAGSALTVALKTLAGTDPTASDPVLLWVRNATAAPASGTPTYALMTITAALSLVISSGSSMGFVNSTAGRLWAVLFNDAGTARIGAINCLSGTDIYPLGGWPIANSTAEGGAGGADNAQTFYTGAAVASKPYAVLGYATWETGLAAAGTWSAGPTRAQIYGPGVALPGQSVQPARTSTGAVATGSTQIPADDTIPQSAEGDQYLSKAITPSSAANVLAVSANIFMSCSSTALIAAALFQDSGANALVTTAVTMLSASAVFPMALAHRLLAGTSSATTFKVRVGTNGGTVTINGQSGSRDYGGVANSGLDIVEIMA